MRDIADPLYCQYSIFVCNIYPWDEAFDHIYETLRVKGQLISNKQLRCSMSKRSIQ